MVVIAAADMRKRRGIEVDSGTREEKNQGHLPRHGKREKAWSAPRELARKEGPYAYKVSDEPIS